MRDENPQKIFLLVLHTQYSEYDSCSQRSSHKTLKVISSDENWDIINKYSAVAEMGDRIATIDKGQKMGGSTLPPFWGVGSWVSI